MLLTGPQLKRFWREWSPIVKQNQWDHSAAEAQRHALLQRAGFTSLKQVDRVAGYTRVLKEIAILKADLGGMMRADQNDRRVLLHAIATLSPSENYTLSIVADRWGHEDMDRLALEDLEQLRNTLAARASTRRRRTIAEALPDPAKSTMADFGNNPF